MRAATVFISSLEWQISASVTEMWPIVGRNASKRKERLIAAAFCRHIAHLMTEERCQRLLNEADRLGTFGDVVWGKPSCLLEAIELAERGDDEPNSEADHDLRELVGRLRYVRQDYFGGYVDGWGPIDYDIIATSTAADALYEVIYWGTRHTREVARHAANAVYLFKGGTDLKLGDWDEEAAQCDLIRDVVQHPELTATIAPAWRTETVVSLARGIYDQRAFDRMPILADALEDAGCDDPTVLRHCRADAPHVRGCWVVDQVLGLE